MRFLINTVIVRYPSYMGRIVIIAYLEWLIASLFNTQRLAGFCMLGHSNINFCRFKKMSFLSDFIKNIIK